MGQAQRASQLGLRRWAVAAAPPQLGFGGDSASARSRSHRCGGVAGHQAALAGELLARQAGIDIAAVDQCARCWASVASAAAIAARAQFGVEADEQVALFDLLAEAGPGSS